MRPMAWPTTRLPSGWAPAVKSSLCGANASLPTVSQVWKSMLVRVAPGLFPPDLVVQIKALACELPATHGLPLSRWSTDDLVRQICQSGLVASISAVRCGVGSRKTPFDPGISAVGSFHAILISPPRQDAFWTSMLVNGKVPP